MKIPEGWAWKTVSDFISHLDAGVSVNGEDNPASSHELGVLKVSAVTEGVFRAVENKKILDSDIGRARVNPKAGKILMSRANSLELIGASAYVPHDYPNLFLSDKLWQLESVHDSSIDMKWLHLVISSPTYRRKISSMATGTSMSMKNISKDIVLSLPLMTPPLPEQKAIADTLSTWDTAIETMERLIAAKERRVIATAQRVISSKSAGWPHMRVEEVFREVSVKNRPVEELLSVTQDRGVLPRSMLEGRVMSPEGALDAYKCVQRGDFVVSLRSFQGGLEYSNYTGIISPAYTVLRPILDVDTEFYRHFFKTYIFIEKYLAVSVIGIRDGKQISIPDFMISQIPYPSISEQSKIASVLNSLREEIDLLRKQLELLKVQKRGLMQRLLTGAWRVPIPQEAP